jgi:flagellar basal-body rod protein FlgG
MLEGLYSAAAGMSAQQAQLDAIGNDLANVSTTGYKAERVAFSDLLYNRIEQAGTATTAGAGANALLLGHTQSQGAIQETGNPLDLAIEGEGFFQVQRPGGEVVLTRDGTFGVDSTGTVTNAEGNPLVPPLKLPAGVKPTDLIVAPDGTVSAGGRALGQIKLVSVASPDHLLAAGGSEFTATASSGAPQPAASAKIHQGAIETSNVDMAHEMAMMVSTQRNYQLASTAIHTESQMMSIANQLRV